MSCAAVSGPPHEQRIMAAVLATSFGGLPQTWQSERDRTRALRRSMPHLTDCVHVLVGERNTNGSAERAASLRPHCQGKRGKSVGRASPPPVALDELRDQGLSILVSARSRAPSRAEDSRFESHGSPHRLRRELRRATEPRLRMAAAGHTSRRAGSTTSSGSGPEATYGTWATARMKMPPPWYG